MVQDFHLFEKMAHFNRERISERQPNAKGSEAFCYFAVTQDGSAYPKVAVFQPGAKTDALIRFFRAAGGKNNNYFGGGPL